MKKRKTKKRGNNKKRKQIVVGGVNYDSGDKYIGETSLFTNKRNGKGIMYYIDGSKYEGEWKDDKKNGKGILTNINGEKYDGEWENGRKNGKGTMIYKDGSQYEGDWKDDKKHGEGIYTTLEEGKINMYKVSFKNDKIFKKEKYVKLNNSPILQNDDNPDKFVYFIKKENHHLEKKPRLTLNKKKQFLRMLMRMIH